jgi:hypothetical protein
VRLIKTLADMVDASGMSRRDKYRMRLALFNRDIRKTIQEQLEAGSSDNATYRCPERDRLGQLRLGSSSRLLG